MAILKFKDVMKMTAQEKDEKIKELKMELIKAKVSGKKGGKSNSREIKKAIARILTSKNTEKINKIKEEK